MSNLSKGSSGDEILQITTNYPAQPHEILV